jgi:hypothetical protein
MCRITRSAPLARFSASAFLGSLLPLRGLRAVRRLEDRIVSLTAERDRLAAELTATREDAARTTAGQAAASGGLAGLRRDLEETAAHLGRARYQLRQVAPAGTRPRQFVFLHIQKTAGISLLERFGREFSYLRTAWVFSPGELDAYESAELAHYDFVCGHFTARNLAQARPGAFACTFLREPVERAVSAYWYFRSHEGLPRRVTRAAVAAAKRGSFLDFLRDPDPEVRWHLDGHQCHAVSADWTAPRRLPPADLVAAAVAGLDRFGYVGVTERLPECLAELCRAAGLPDLGPPGRVNATAGRPRAEDLTPAERAAAAEVCATDAELYRVVRARVDARLAPARPV